MDENDCLNDAVQASASNYQSNVAYIVQMKAGLNRFIYREICALKNSGVNIILFPLKHSKGPYMPEESWKVFYPTVGRILSGFVHALIKYPIRFLYLFKESLFSHSFIDFCISLYFSLIMEKNDISCIHCHFADHKLFVGYYCKKILDIPLFVTVHAYELYNNPNPRMLIRSFNECDSIITISEYNKQILINDFNVSEKKIIVNYLFVESLNRDESKIKILIVGRYVEKKGHDVLFQALRELKREDVVLWIAGIGDDSHLKNLAHSLGVDDRIVFFGEVSDQVLNVLYEHCDIFCLPSKSAENGDSEGIPVALMEAMSYSKPVVSTKHAGIPELVENYLIKENDYKGLAVILKELIDNPDLRRIDGSKNKQIINRKFSEKNACLLKKLFRENKNGIRFKAK